MENLISSLEKSCEELELLNEVLKKCNGDTSRVSEMLFWKKLEDGYIENFHKASLSQLNMMKSSFRFKYYPKEDMDKLIDAAIIKVTRKQKLNIINETVN